MMVDTQVVVFSWTTFLCRVLGWRWDVVVLLEESFSPQTQQEKRASGHAAGQVSWTGTEL